MRNCRVLRVTVPSLAPFNSGGHDAGSSPAAAATDPTKSVTIAAIEARRFLTFIRIVLSFAVYSLAGVDFIGRHGSGDPCHVRLKQLFMRKGKT
jgi:hypothetical protein